MFGLSHSLRLFSIPVLILILRSWNLCLLRMQFQVVCKIARRFVGECKVHWMESLYWILHKSCAFSLMRLLYVHLSALGYVLLYGFGLFDSSFRPKLI